MTTKPKPTIARHHAWAKELRDRFGDCGLSRELADMLGIVRDDGFIAFDDLERYDLAAAGPEVRKSAAIERPVDMNVRPKVSTAPDALRNLPAVVVQVKPKPQPKPKSVAAPKPQRSGPKRSDTPECGTYAAKKRHKRRKEPVCDLCAPIPLTDPRDKERKARYRRAQGVQPRKRIAKPTGPRPVRTGPAELQPCSTEAAYRRHIKKRTPVCDACRDAHNGYNRQLDAERRNAA